MWCAVTFGGLTIDAKLHTAKTFDLVWMWLGGDYGNVFLMGFNGIQWVGLLLIIEDSFLPLVDFIEASPLRYALTVKPTVYVSHICQFWSTARIETTEEGTKILATGKGSGAPTEPHHTPSLEADPLYHTTSSMPLPSIPTAPISPVTQTETTSIRDVSEGEAYPTDSGFIADQDRATIAKSSSLPHDSAPRAQEVEIRKLKDRVKVLEDREGVAATQSGDDAPIKGRSIDEGEAATERISDDSEELERVLTSMDAVTVLAGGIDIPTGSGFIPTVGPPVGDIPTGSDDIPTVSPVFATAIVVTPYSRRKGKEVMVKFDTPKKQRSNLGWKVKDFKGMTFEEIEEKFNMVWKQVEEFIPMGSKAEAERHKRKGIRFDQESSKKLKSSEEVIKDVKSTEEIPKEKMKEMMQLTQNFMHALVEWKLYDLCRVHQVTTKDKDIFMLVEKDYPLRKGLAIVMISYKLQEDLFKDG
nr:hypothetical protein [Tanacetum cinerariifolium]